MPESTQELKKQVTKLTKEIRQLGSANKKLNERVLELFTLYNVSKTLSLSLDLDDLFETAVKIIGETLNVSEYNLMLLQEETGQLVMRAVHGTKKEKIQTAALEASGEMPTKVIKGKKTILIKDIAQRKGAVHYNGTKVKSGSYLGIPLKIPRGKVIGVLNAHKPAPNAFTKEDVKLFETVAEHVSVAIENARAYQRTKELSHRDDLTSLYNRRYFFDRLEKEVERAKRYERTFSLILIDIDHFKNYNDTHGHLEGDRALKNIAEVINNKIRKADILARYGGEEFVVILPETDKESAIIAGEKLRAGVEKLNLRDGRSGGPLTITLGVSSFPLDTKEAIELLERADQALYFGKAQGRNRVCAKVPN